jgi:hypothetical protein
MVSIVNDKFLESTERVDVCNIVLV